MSNASSAESSTRFGTFGGVFTPCTLTILGVIMFLRFGYVVGQSGLINAIIIVLAAKLITTLTALSLSAVATNTRVKGGGAYFLISRSLGVEFGGAIGVVFFLAQAISIAMYVVGFAEAFTATFPSLSQSTTLVATIANAAVFICVYIGAGWTIKVQFGILIILGLSLVSFFAGAIPDIDPSILRANIHPNYQGNESSFTMFALFFPAVTGIMAGANMSGDLKDAGRSIPSGTLLAVAVTSLIYLAMAVTFAAVRTGDQLVADNLIINEIAWSPMLITAGVFAATLSSALGSMMGSPRILQAFARDRVFNWLTPMAMGSGPANEPRRATVLTFVIAQSGVMLGDLNRIAPIITMFFMITYATLNLATFYESITGNPSYRPRFRYCHWSLSLIGAVGCVIVMFLIAPVWATVAMVAMGGLHWLIGIREVESRWGSVRSGLLFERTRTNLLKLEEELYHPKNWRPIVLALSGAGWTRTHLAIFGHWLTAGHGVLSLGQIIHAGSGDRPERRANQERVLRAFIREQELEAFPALVVADSIHEGIEAMVQCHGLGGIKPNTVLLGWPNDPQKADSFGSLLRTLTRLGQNIIAVRSKEEVDNPWQAPSGTIDVWWRGKENGPLLLLLAHLLTKNNQWRTRSIRLIRVAPTKAAHGDIEQHLRKMLTAARINAEPLVILGDMDGKLVEATSRSASIVFLGMQPPVEGEETALYESVEKLAGDLPRVVLVRSAGSIELDS